MNQNDPATQSWHFDKRLPVALIATLAIQTAVAVWWAATTTSRIDNVESAVRTNVTTRLNRIEDKLDRLIEGRFGVRQ